MFIKMLPVMAAVVLATSCSKDDNSNVAIDDTVTPEPANEVAENSVKTITIKGKVSQASLSKVTVEGKTLKFEIWNDADEFKFNNGKTGDSKVEGSIMFTSADGEYTANFSFTDEEELTSSAGFSTSLNTRGADEGFIRYSKAYVHYTNGLVILPDNWNGTYTFSNHDKSNGNFQSISNNDWATLEKEGAVFLPFAGRRGGYSIDCVTGYGLYWLATKYSNDCGYMLRFQSKSVEPQGISDIRYGHSVRLVRDAE